MCITKNAHWIHQGNRHAVLSYHTALCSEEVHLEFGGGYRKGQDRNTYKIPPARNYPSATVEIMTVLISRLTQFNFVSKLCFND